jgi:hypothetical protein
MVRPSASCQAARRAERSDSLILGSNRRSIVRPAAASAGSAQIPEAIQAAPRAVAYSLPAGRATGTGRIDVGGAPQEPHVLGEPLDGGAAHQARSFEAVDGGRADGPGGPEVEAAEALGDLVADAEVEERSRAERAFGGADLEAGVAEERRLLVGDHAPDRQLGADAVAVGEAEVGVVGEDRGHHRSRQV